VKDCDLGDLGSLSLPICWNQQFFALSRIQEIDTLRALKLISAKKWGGLLGGGVAALLSSVYGNFTAPIPASAIFNFIGILVVSP